MNNLCYFESKLSAEFNLRRVIHMSAKLDVVIIGSGPGGLSAAIIAKQHSKSCLIIEKGSHTMQGIIDTYPKGKKVYPTIPNGIQIPSLLMK